MPCRLGARIETIKSATHVRLRFYIAHMSGTLAIILGVVAGILILGGLGAILYNRQQRRSLSQKYQASMPARSPEDELSALGILEIKPRSANKEADDEEVEVIEVEASEPAEDNGEAVEEAAEDPEDEVQEATDERDEDVVEEEVHKTVVRDDEVLAQDGKRAGVSRREALFRLLNAVQASVDGYTACLIKREQDGQCEVEAIISQDPKSIGTQRVRMDALLEDKALEGTAVLVKDIDAGISAEELLGYYEQPVAVRQVAIAPIKAPGDEANYFLLVDALGWQDLDDPWQRLMIGQFATLLGTFMSTPVTEGETGDYIKPRVRPRREIIAEEIERARTGRQPLALALIYLNHAEAIAETGGKAISDAERAMANRLELSVNGGRLERFGELTYGIFQDEGVSEVEAWALQLQEELLKEGDYFEGGVSIGIALLQDRHKDADEFRADATEALREAFESGATTIIE